MDGNARGGTIYELGGPEVKTFKQLMQYVLATIERKRLLVPMPFFAAKMQGDVPAIHAEAARSRPIRSNCCASTTWCRDAAKAEGRTLQGLGIEPEPIEAIVPSYLWRFRKTGQFKSRTA